MEVHSGRDIHLQPLEGPVPEQVNTQRELLPHGKSTEQAPGRNCRTMESITHTGAGLLARLVTPWGPTMEQSVPEEQHWVEESYTGAASEM